MIWKRELEFAKPLMNAAGTLGFARDLRAPGPWEFLGAFVTNPVSLRPRSATAAPALLEYAGGFLLHTGLPNPGFAAVLHQYAERWKVAPSQIVVHLMADRPEETQSMVRALEAVENVGAVELGFAPLLADDVILLAVEMSRGELPLIANLPPEQVLRVGPRAIDRGARAVSMASPRGTLIHDGRMVSGRLCGPSLFPAALDLVGAAVKAGIPIIGAGGVGSQSEADAMLAAGAIGVQLDTQLWLPSVTKKASSV